MAKPKRGRRNTAKPERPRGPLEKPTPPEASNLDHPEPPGMRVAVPGIGVFPPEDVRSKPRSGNRRKGPSAR